MRSILSTSLPVWKLCHDCKTGVANMQKIMSIGLIGVALVTLVTITGCTYSVTSPDDEGIETPDVAIDPALIVSGLEVFQQTISDEGDNCSIEVDYRDHVLRTTQAAWQKSRDAGLVEPNGAITFDSLSLRAECTTSSVGLIIDQRCSYVGRMSATFVDGDSPPATRSAMLSQQMSGNGCGGVAEQTQITIGEMLTLVLIDHFGVPPDRPIP